MKAITDTLESKVFGRCILISAGITVIQVMTLRGVGRTDILTSPEMFLAVGLPLLTVGLLWITALVFRRWMREQRDWHVWVGFIVDLLLLALITVLVLVMFTDFSIRVNELVPLVPISERGYVMERSLYAGMYFVVAIGGFLYVRGVRFRMSRETKSARSAQPVSVYE